MVLKGVTDTTFEAIVIDWDAAAHVDAAPVRCRVEALCAAGVHVFVASSAGVDDVDGQLAARPAGPGRLHLCTDRGSAVFEVGASGVDPVWRRDATDHDDGAHEWAAAWLAARGIAGGLVLFVGGVNPVASALARARVESAGAEPDPDRLVRLLDQQLARRLDRRVPWIDEDPEWTITIPDDAERERAAEALGAVGNGFAAVRGSREEDGRGSAPLFAVNGAYTRDASQQLLQGPDWTALWIEDGRPDRRLLDLRTGLLAREGLGASALRTVRFVSAARPRIMALRAEGDAEHVRTCAVATPTSGAGGGGIAVVTREHQQTRHGRRTVERIAAWDADDERPADEDAAVAQLEALRPLGFDGVLAEHRAAWAERWADAEVVIEGDPGSQLAARYAVFHLLSAAGADGETAIGARGLTGPAYGGHVFWDADVYVLPALAAVHPGAARAMLEYRIRRLPAAWAAARRLGRRGARFPWESALDGTDVTPSFAEGLHGVTIPVSTGEREEHIVADVAWAATEYDAWSGDGFLTGPGRPLLLDTARYWATRIRVGDDGVGHIDGVMGPDEYHEAVDDNAFTNVMARWNLRAAARLVYERGGDAAEAAGWRRVADSLADGWDAERGLYEQFAGYWDLEPLLVAAVAQPPVAADFLLGSERVQQTQLLKQADVVMLHHLVPGEVHPGSLRSQLDFYEPRTAHGSSLSPAIHAALFARAGQPERALELFRLAARLDLDDVTGTTAGGLHLATMGGVWQALAYGFLGLRPATDGLTVDPQLPASWNALALRLRFHGRPIGVRAEHDAVSITCDTPLTVRVGHGRPVVCHPPGQRFTLEGSTP